MLQTLSFMTLTLLERTGQLFYRMPLSLDWQCVLMIWWGTVCLARKYQMWCALVRAPRQVGRDAVCVRTSWVVFGGCRDEPRQPWHRKYPLTGSQFLLEVRSPGQPAGLSAQSHKAEIQVSAGLHLIRPPPASSAHSSCWQNSVSWLQGVHFSCWRPLSVPRGHSQGLARRPSIYKGNRRISLCFNPSHIFNL